MRLLAYAMIAVLLLTGCLQQPGGNQTNATPTPPQNPAPPVNETVPLQNQSAGNISQIPTTQPLPPNITLNQTATNQTDNANATAPANETVKPAGLPFPDSDYSLFLDDVSLVPTSSEPCGIFSIRDQNMSILDKLLICPPESQNWVSPQGHLYRIRVDEVAAGYTMQTNWAKVEIFG